MTSRSYSSTSIEDAMKKAEEPPTPPPRPQKTHSRASSLDLNKLFQQGAPGMTCSSHHIISAIRKVRSTNSWEQQCVLQLSYYVSFMAVLLLRGTKAEMEMPGFQSERWETHKRAIQFVVINVHGIFEFKEGNLYPESKAGVWHHCNVSFSLVIPGVKSGWLLPPPALPPRPTASQVVPVWLRFWQ